MSLLTRFEREYDAVRRFVWFRPAAWGASVLLAALVAGAVLLADGRWLSLPRVVPFALWGALIGGAIIAWRRARARVAHDAARVVHAAAVEEELGLREAQLRVILELPDAGSWTTRAVERVAGRVPAADAPLAA
ncbi:MAG: hypothetical protein K2X99_03720, partial [Gemmatimonadaceae bacterium]|nr:hypothetical protein [Gemmatimonadaceae bacterium]